MLWYAVSIIIIIVLAVLFNKTVIFFKNRKHGRMVDLSVKKKLITAENYSRLDDNVLRLVRRVILRVHISVFLMCAAVGTKMLIAAIIGNTGAGAVIFIVTALTCIGAFLGLKAFFEMKRLSPPDRLVKIKGFVFRTRGSNEISVMYYDMVKLRYSIFTRDMFFLRSDTAQLGTFVNLIGIKNRRRVKIYRILTF